MTMPTIDTLVNIPGDLRTAYHAAVPGTLRHVDQLMNERRTNPKPKEGVDLREMWFYTPDGALYFMDGKTKTLAMTRESENLVLRHLDDDASSALTRGRNYYPDLTEAVRAIKAPMTEVFDLDELGLRELGEEFSVMEFSTTKHNTLHREQRRFAERVYGRGRNFVWNMKMLAQRGTDKVRVYVLNPEYVQEHATAGVIARASRLGYFDDSSSFYAGGRCIVDYLRVRGEEIMDLISPSLSIHNNQK